METHHNHGERGNPGDLVKTQRRTYAAAGALELAARGGLTKEQRLLVQLRASFINGCHYCIGMHSREALATGHSQAWLDAIRDWTGEVVEAHRSPVFAEGEALILEFTTAGTVLSGGFDPGLRERVIGHFGVKTTGALISAIAAINTWNRLGVLSGK